MKNILYFIILIIVTFSYGQEVVFKSQIFNEDVITTSSFKNSDNGDLLLIHQDEKRIKAFQLDKEYSIKNRIYTKNIPSKYSSIIGYTTYKDNYKLYLLHSNKKKYATLNFNFKLKNTFFEEKSFDLKKEKYVQTFTHKNRVHIVTVDRKLPMLYFYKFELNGIFKKHIIDFKDKKFKINGDKVNLSKFIVNSIFEQGSSLEIESGLPYSLDQTSSFNKFYVKEKNVIFTFDSDRKITYVIDVNLDDFSYNIKEVEKPKIDTKHSFISSNSYLLNDKWFQVANSSKKFIFQIKNYETDEVLNNFSFTDKDSINFKNSNLVIDKSNKSQLKNLQLTKKYLRRLRDFDIGVSAYENNGKIQVLLGGGISYEVAKQDPLFYQFGLVGFILLDTFDAFEGYSNSKSIYFITELDKDMNHVKGKYSENIFDKMKKYKIEKNVGFYGHTFLKNNDDYLFGYFSQKDKRYYLVKFNN